MVAARFLLTSFIAAASATSLSAREDVYLSSLLKRQEPGTPAYNCHDNCGSAIKLGRGADPCNNAVFIADYNNCLKCSGPDNYNIWRYYGGGLSGAGAKCGLDTEPLSGKQEDVPPAGSTGAASSAASAQTSAATQNSLAASSPVIGSSAAQSSVAAPTSSQAAAATGSGTSEATPLSSVTVLPSLQATATITTTSLSPIYSSLVANRTLSSFTTCAPSSSANATASSTASGPAQVTTNAAAGLHIEGATSIFGAIFVGALFGM